jgi:hypothetical protein
VCPPTNRSPHCSAFVTNSGHQTLLSLCRIPHPRRSHLSKPSNFYARMEFWRGPAAGTLPYTVSLM